MKGSWRAETIARTDGSSPSFPYLITITTEKGRQVDRCLKALRDECKLTMSGRVPGTAWHRDSSSSAHT